MMLDIVVDEQPDQDDQHHDQQPDNRLLGEDFPLDRRRSGCLFSCRDGDGRDICSAQLGGSAHRIAQVLALPLLDALKEPLHHRIFLEDLRLFSGEEERVCRGSD